MEATLQIPLGEQVHLRAFFKEQAEDVDQLMNYLQEMRIDFSEAMDEIRYLREQIDMLQNQSTKAALRKIQEEVKTAVISSKKQMEAITSEVVRIVDLAAEHIKQKGRQVVDKIFEMSHVERGLGRVALFLYKSLDALGNQIHKIEPLAEELHAMKAHAGNIGRAVTGKPLQELKAHDHTQGILAKVEKSLGYCRKIIAGLAEKTVLARAYVVHLHEISKRNKESDVPTVPEIARQMKADAKMTFSIGDKSMDAR